MAKTNTSGRATIAYSASALHPQANPNRATIRVGNQSAVIDATSLVPPEQIEAQKVRRKIEACSKRCEALDSAETAAVNGFCLKKRQVLGHDCDQILACPSA